MPTKQWSVEAKRFEAMTRCYSGDLLAKNKCRAIEYEGKLWTATGIWYLKGDQQVILHELVLPEMYDGPTGTYPFRTDDVFYKGQVVTVRSETYVMNGHRIEVDLIVENEDAGQQELFEAT